MNELIILVGAVDKYKNAWKPFKHGFDKYWKDCPFKVKFITNELNAPEGFETIKVGKDISWGDTVKIALEHIETEFILWMMEDYWLTNKPNTKKIIELIDKMKQDNLNHIRLLAPSDADGNVILDKECGNIYNQELSLYSFKPTAEYKASLAPSIWRTEIFKNLVKEGETPWQYETRAGKECKEPEKHLCCIDTSIINWGWYTNPNPIYRSSMIRKGMWTESAYAYVKNENIDMDMSHWMNGAIVSPNTRIRVPEWLYVGKNSIIDDFCYISTKIEIGKYCHIASNCSIAGGKDMIFRMGDYSSLSSGVKIWLRSNDFINDLIICGSYNIGENNCKGNVILGKYTGVGSNTVIMPNNNIPEGVAIGGMSWVPTNYKFEPWMIYAGIPIKPIKSRNKENILKQVELMEER